MMNCGLSHSFISGGNMSGPSTNEVPCRSTWDLMQMFDGSPESLKQKSQTPDLSSFWSPNTPNPSLPNSIMHVMSAMNPAAKAFNTQNTISGPSLPYPFVNQNFTYPTATSPEMYSFSCGTFFNEFGQPVNVAQYNEGGFPFSGSMVYPNPFLDTSAASWFPNPSSGGEPKTKPHQLNPEAEEYIPRTMRPPSPPPPPSAAEVHLPPHSSTYESITKGFDPCNMPPPAQSDYGFISADGNECCEFGHPSDDPANEELSASNCDAKEVPSEALAKAAYSTNLFEGDEVPRNASEDCDPACVGGGSPVGSCEGAESVSEFELEDSEEEEEEEEETSDEEEDEDEEEDSESEASDSDDGICFETVEDDDDDDDDDDGISFKDDEETLTAAVELSSFTEESSFESDGSDDVDDDDSESKRGSSDSNLLLQADDSSHDDYDCELFNLEDDSWGCAGGGLHISNITSTPTSSVGKWTDMVSPYCDGFDEFDCVHEEEEEEEDEEDYERMEEELKQVNQLWEEQVTMDVSESTPTKVKFNDEIRVEPVEAWCRQGPWEQYARDAMRFRSFIATVGTVLSPILATEHRDKVYQKLINQSSD